MIDPPPEHPILFSGPLVCAILEGRKTVTRRLVSPTPPAWVTEFGYSAFTPPDHISARGNHTEHGAAEKFYRFRYGTKGDRLWVRERMRVVGVVEAAKRITHVRLVYEADGFCPDGWKAYPERLAQPKIDQCLPYGGPREFSRILLEVVSVGVERLQDVTEEDAKAEGVSPCLRCGGSGVDPVRVDGVDPEWCSDCGGGSQGLTARDEFVRLWDQINGKRCAWASNPWVWRVEFRRLEVPA